MSAGGAARPLTLRAGPDRVTVDPGWGGMLTSLVAGGAERLRQPGPGEETPTASFPMWGSFVMAPWVGRLGHAVVEWEGLHHRLPPTWRGHAIHGLVADRPWCVESASETHVSLACRLPDAWPFGGVVRQRVGLERGSLTLTLRVQASGKSMPAAVGWHPWFQRPTSSDLAITVAADRVLELDSDLLPTGRIHPVDERTDLRNGPAVGDRDLDTAYVGVVPPLHVVWPDLELRMSIDAPSPCAVVYTGDPASVCVEPMSAWPNAPALEAAAVPATGLTRLPPGGVLVVTTTWEWLRGPRAVSWAQPGRPTTVPDCL